MAIKFSRTKKVDEYIGSILYPLGFHMRSNPPRYYWVFSRKKDDVTQTIEVKASYIGDWDLNLRYYTSLHPFPISIVKLLYKKNQDPKTWLCVDKRGVWVYSDEAEFVEILKIFQRLIKAYVLDELEDMSIFDSEVRVTTVNYLYLKENADDIITKGREEWKLDGINFEEKIRKLSGFIDDLKGKEFSTVERELSHIGMVYGEIVRETFGGYRTWIESSNGIIIDYVANRSIFIWPVSTAFEIWQEEKSFEQEIGQIKEAIQKKEELSKNIQRIISKKFKKQKV